MRFHVVNLAHTQTTDEFSWCAYTQKTKRFASMMHDAGHDVFLYAGEENEARCTELIPCITRDEQPDAIPQFDADAEPFKTFNTRAIYAIQNRIEPQDFICIIGGLAQKPIADAFGGHLAVEYGVGYGGVFSNYKVFESYAWMHTVYGALSGGDSHGIDGAFFDDVIPNYYDVDDFPFSAEKEDYVLFVGRLIPRKGIDLAVEVCREMGQRLVVAGAGDPPDYGEYVGVVGPKERGELMSKAKALICPSLYLEPFGGVSIESILCGTPVISTDWGAFSENIMQGVTGFRCRMFSEFCEAIDNAPQLMPSRIRRYGVQYFSIEAVRPQYEAYFERLMTLWGDGFYDRQ